MLPHTENSAAMESSDPQASQRNKFLLHPEAMTNSIAVKVRLSFFYKNVLHLFSVEYCVVECMSACAVQVWSEDDL